MRHHRQFALMIGVILAAGSVVVAPPASSADTIDPLQPGDIVYTPAGQCTLNFAYDGIGVNAGKVYLGTAAHCVSEVGQPTEDIFHDVFGKVAFFGDYLSTYTEDYAFIEVLPEHVHRVRAGVKGHPQYPVGVTQPGTTAAGELVQFSGQGTGFAWTLPTQEQRRGVIAPSVPVVADGMLPPPVPPPTAPDPRLYYATGPILWGDSGGPAVHVPTGTALGVISHLCNFPGPPLNPYPTTPSQACSVSGPTIHQAIAHATAAGFPVVMRTVTG